MNVIAISGSRNPNGQTNRALAAFCEGLELKGATVRTVLLPELKIERCRQCDANGWGTCRSEGKCVIEDDVHDLTALLKATDAAVFATPVYFSDLSESLRALLDRLRRQCVNEPGRHGIAGKPAIGICVAGGGGGGAPQCCTNLTWTLQTAHFDVVDVFPVRRQNLANKLDELKAAGKDWATVLGG